MLIEAHETVNWREVWVILEMKDGAVFKVKNTGRHVPEGTVCPEGHQLVAINAKPNTQVMINPLES